MADARLDFYYSNARSGSENGTIGPADQSSHEQLSSEPGSNEERTSPEEDEHMIVRNLEGVQLNEDDSPTDEDNRDREEELPSPSNSSSSQTSDRDGSDENWESLDYVR